MIKQYGIDPKLVIWIQRNTGHDLQTFSDLYCTPIKLAVNPVILFYFIHYIGNQA